MLGWGWSMSTLGYLEVLCPASQPGSGDEEPCCARGWPFLSALSAQMWTQGYPLWEVHPRPCILPPLSLAGPLLAGTGEVLV